MNKTEESLLTISDKADLEALRERHRRRVQARTRRQHEQERKQPKVCPQCKAKLSDLDGQFCSEFCKVIFPKSVIEG